ncbi:MAG: acyl-CoA dehydrogenase N-terminal domain-containing protein, partial [Pseudomonadales bacterium]|nr:acyl-CoA dehydrogenase N-terminal domain-containing protein [Pseudomonadales bacterium]
MVKSPPSNVLTLSELANPECLLSNLQASDFIMADYKAPLRDMRFVLNEV